MSNRLRGIVLAAFVLVLAGVIPALAAKAGGACCTGASCFTGASCCAHPHS
jgi:hypothetical protein